MAASASQAVTDTAIVSAVERRGRVRMPRYYPCETSFVRVLDTPITMPIPASTTAQTPIHCGLIPAMLAPYARPPIKMTKPMTQIASDST